MGVKICALIHSVILFSLCFRHAMSALDRELCHALAEGAKQRLYDYMSADTPST